MGTMPKFERRPLPSRRCRRGLLKVQVQGSLRGRHGATWQEGAQVQHEKRQMEGKSDQLYRLCGSPE